MPCVPGVLIKELGQGCGELSNTEDVHDMSLSDDETTLALACREEGVKLFEVKKQRNLNNKLSRDSTRTTETVTIL